MVAARVPEQNAHTSGQALAGSDALDRAGSTPDLAEACERANGARASLNVSPGALPTTQAPGSREGWPSPEIGWSRFRTFLGRG